MRKYFIEVPSLSVPDQGASPRPEEIFVQKLKLQLDDLRVETFDTVPVQKVKGTVFGEQCTCYTECTCPGCATCEESCDGTCGWSCSPSNCGDPSCGTACESCYDCMNVH